VYKGPDPLTQNGDPGPRVFRHVPGERDETNERDYFAPLNETVPVYQRPVTALQEIVAEVTPEAQQAMRGQET